MKNILSKITFLCLFVMIFVSCKKDKLDSSNQKLVSSFTYTVGTDSTKNFSEEKFIYNNAGQLIRVEFENKENGIAKYKRYTDYEYNTDSLLSKVLSVGTLGVIFSNTISYNYTNKILTNYKHSSSSRNDEYNYVYNTDGTLMKMTWIYNSVPTDYTYKYVDNKINSYEKKEGLYTDKYVVEGFNNNGLVANIINYSLNFSNPPIHRNRYSYDDEGNITQSVYEYNGVVKETSTSVFDNKKPIHNLSSPLLPKINEPFYGRIGYSETHNRLSYTVTDTDVNNREYIRERLTNTYEYNSQGYPTKITQNGTSYNEDGSVRDTRKTTITTYKFQ